MDEEMAMATYNASAFLPLQYDTNDDFKGDISTPNKTLVLSSRSVELIKYVRAEIDLNLIS